MSDAWYTVHDKISIEGKQEQEGTTCSRDCFSGVVYFLASKKPKIESTWLYCYRTAKVERPD